MVLGDLARLVARVTATAGHVPTSAFDALFFSSPAPCGLLILTLFTV
jgi:hypothetical protein